MSDPVRFLTSMAQALATMSLYAEGHPARVKAADASFDLLRELQASDPTATFSFLGSDVIYGQRTLRALSDWDWATRLANAGIQRLEFSDVVEREEYRLFLEDVLTRLSVSAAAAAATAGTRPPRAIPIRFGAVGVRGPAEAHKEDTGEPDNTGAIHDLNAEADAIRWMHEEVTSRDRIPLVEAEAVVRSLSVAMHSDSQVVMPLLTLKEFDQYTTTHSLNVSVLAMALAEFMGLSPREVRAFGVAGMLHDLGKVKIPKEILRKPGNLSPPEWAIMRAHPLEGARLILESDKHLDMAAVVAFEHHIMINGGGYPDRYYRRDCHHGSCIVHVCDVYDALRTKRPYRDAWAPEATLAYIEKGIGTEFHTDTARAFIAMMKQWEPRLAVAEMGAEEPAMAGSA